MKFPPLYKRAVDGVKINKWTIEVNGNCYRTISGYHNGVQTTSEWTCCEAKNIGKKNGTTPEQQAMSEAESKYQKRKDAGFWPDINDCDKKVFFQPMLAQDWDDVGSKVKFPLLSDPKLDGVRCIIKLDGMWSRNGKQLISAPHIFEDLKPLFEQYPDLILDGELYADKNKADFNKIISCVRKTKPTIPDLVTSAAYIQYWVYDIPSFDGTAIQRKLYLQELDLPDICIKVPFVEVGNPQAVIDMHRIYVGMGYEGQILRIPDGLYENKRSKYLIKHKSFISEEYIILGVTEGIGNLSGKLGTLSFEREGKLFNAAVNGTWEYLEELWRNRETLIGKTATVKYFELTTDKIPRFPKVIQIDRWSYE
jgi:DNA ligase-1